MEKSSFVLIFGNSPFVKVLDFFIGFEYFDYSIAFIAKETETKWETVEKAIEILLQRGILKKTRKLGKAQLYMLDKENPLTKLLIEIDMKIPKEVKKLLTAFKLYPGIKLVYLFGSQANGKTGPLSDYDFAVYVDEKDPQKRFNLRLEIISEISEVLKTDKINVCLLNDIEDPELKYNIIKEGFLIFEKEPFKVLIEPRILNEYFDFHAILLKHNLTKA